MKKLTAIVLTLTMLFSLIGTIPTMAEEKLAEIENLTTGEKYTLGTIEWDYKDNAQYLINAFEMSDVKSIESTTDYYQLISGQKYINSKSAILQDTIAEVLEKENTEKYTKTRGMSYYPTDKIQTATGTFPAADGNYYITTPKGVKFRIDGVTNTVGGNGVTAGYVTMNVSDEDGGSVYKADFDGETKYNSVNLLVAGVDEPVWNGWNRMTSAAQANVYYADGSVEKQLVLIPSVWGYVPTLAGKLKTEDQLTGTKQPIPYVIATSSVLGLCSDAEKFSWTPSNIDAEVFSVGSYMTTAFTNTAEERYAFKEMTNKAGAMASVKVDTKGKAVDYIEITHTEDEVLEAAGAFNASRKPDTHEYWLPISNEDVIKLVGEDKTGVLKGKTDAKISECDFYIKIQRNCRASGRGAMGILMAASGEKKYASLMDYIEEAQAEMIKITETSSIEDAIYAEGLFNNVVGMEGIKETDFDANILATFKANLNAVKKKANVSGTIEMTYVKGTKPVANVTIKNLSALAGKQYKVIIACYDENKNLLGTTVEDCVSSTEKEVTFTVTAKTLPEGTKTVKGFIWKDFTTLIPLATADEAVASSYALDDFFDIETGKFKKSEGELNIAFIGDSLTEGTSSESGGISGNDGLKKTHWTYVISKYFEDKTDMTVNLYNAGIGGTITEFSVPLVKSTVFSKKPDIVILENVNDLGSNAAQYEAAVENIIRRLLSLNKKPLIMYYHAAIPYTPDDGTQWPVVVSTGNNGSWTTQETKKSNIDAICAKYGVPVIDYLSYFRTYTNDAKDKIMTTLYREKNVHPKEAGYQLMGTFATGEFDAKPAKYFVKHNDVEDVTAKYATSEDSYILTQPNSSRFTYKGFTNYATYTAETNAALINERQFKYPFSGNVQQATTAGATIEFTTDTTELIVYSVNPTQKYRSNYADIYVDETFAGTLNGANPYENNYNYKKITTGLDGELHKVKIVTREPVTHESGSKLDIFNFMFIAEKE